MAKTTAAVKNRYNNKAYDRIALSVPKGTKDAWKDRAAALGLSLNAYIRECVLAAEKTGHLQKGGPKILIDLTALNARITASGIKRTVIAREMNVSPPTLRRKLRGNTPMTDNDMETLGKVLNLNRNEMMRIFFAREMN